VFSGGGAGDGAGQQARCSCAFLLRPCGAAHTLVPQHS
jgi:hypothetical protein